MFKFINNILKPPVFDNEKDTHQAYLLNMILWGLVLITIPYAVFVPIVEPQSAGRVLAQTGIGLAINLFLFFLMHRGYVREASTAQVVSFWIFFSAIAFSGNGVQDEAYSFGYLLVILITGLLLGPKPAFWVAVLSLVAGVIMLYQNSIGVIPSPINNQPYSTWIISFVIFPMIVLLQYLSSRSLNAALERVRLSDEKQKLISKVSTDYTFESVVNEKGEGTTIWLAGAFEKMTGYSPEEYIARGGWYAHIHPDDLEKDNSDMQKLFKNQDVVNSEIRTFVKNGDIRWERVFAHPVWSEKENRLVGIVGAVQDITQEKIAEEMLKETILRQNAILNNIPDMAWLKDVNSRYIAVNEQFLNTCGFSPDFVIGKTDYEIWKKEFADNYRQDDLEVMQNGKRRQLEELQRDNTGREYWVETIKTPIRNANGQVVGTIGIAREITERKLAEIERETLIKELETKNTELERFTYTVSHDLKSPLVTITGFLNYLEKNARAGDFDKFNKDVMRIHQAVNKMQTLLKDLLELSRIGRIVNEPIEINFGEIVHEALALVDGSIKARGVRIEFIDDKHKIFGDRIRLIEVLQNLIENAVKFMGDQPDPLIRIGAVTDSINKETFFVQDNGIGIDSQFMDRIFGLFNKLGAETHGSGIGLTLIKRIIEVHGGRVWVESQLGKGSTFYFTLS